eukprot:CAMPEP_0176042562 /NCGR_PEP_ID=MMETSP0120_2-20121206/21119_1 /TAXON_ID=160619 /ORGANISM="Kryptoperidinium foliaceum, Strain CCMP 1326" /LENGTH=239 /DNA_ID=CAMNT_0017375971 /DNA_START=53 /DNA_END=772 /DNA_ORIENTATION=+
MKAVLFAAIAGSAAAFVPQSAPKASTAANAAIDDLKAIAEKSNPVLKYYDPLELANTSIWGSDQAGTIGFLRHAEIKHGRIAMAAFVGYIVQSNGIHWPWPMTIDGTPFPYDAGSPPEQWDALPDAAKWQIILFIGFLEHFSESNGTHYMKGGKPGAYPKFSDSDKIPHPVPFNLFDPFGFSNNRSEEAKERGRIAEINNGRLAQIGILGFLSEQKLAGSVPLLEGIVPPYAGEPMAPF